MEQESQFPELKKKSCPMLSAYSDPFHMGRGAKDSSGAGPFPPQGSGSHTSCQFCPLPDIHFP